MMQMIYIEKGFTLLELMIVITIIAILASIALPAFEDSIERRKLIAAAEMLSSDMQWAKSESIRTNQQITIDFTDASNGLWGYSIFPTNPSKDVSAALLSEFNDINLSQNFGSDDTGFEPVRGLALENGSATFSSDNYSIRVVLSLIGRVRICSNNISGVDAC
jgi:type IV fimbrial biogenesis protein FimT